MRFSTLKTILIMFSLILTIKIMILVSNNRIFIKDKLILAIRMLSIYSSHNSIITNKQMSLELRYRILKNNFRNSIKTYKINKILFKIIKFPIRILTKLFRQ